MNVAVIGLGIVGSAQHRVLERAGATVDGYDPAYSDEYPADAIADCDFAMICVGTPATPAGPADLGGVTFAVHRLPSALPVLIRSTVPPGTTDRLRLITGRYAVTCHAPEFMCERDGGVWAESDAVPWMLLGGTREGREFFAPLLAEVFPGTIHECTALEAELAKYTANLYWANRVTFVNELARVCELFGADWAGVRAAWLADERVCPDYTAMAGFPPGFGGRCWPKDLSALIAAAETAGGKPGFLRAIQEANARFTS